MPEIELLNRIPPWIQYFVAGGVIFVVIAVPLRMIWSATRGLRKRGEMLDQFTDRLRERFNEVSVSRGIIGPASVTFKHEARKVTAIVHGSGCLVLRLSETVSPKFPLVIKTKGRWAWPWSMVGLRVLPRVRMFDSLVDESVAIYTTLVFGNYLRDMVLDAVTLEGKPSGITESLVVLRKRPGVRRFRLTTAPEGAMAMKLRLRTEDMFYRPEEIETIIHHMGQLYDRFVKY